MKKLYLMTALSLLSLSFAVFSPAFAEEKDSYSLGDLFLDADITKDSMIDKGEFDIFHFLSFVLLDADDNGVVQMDECTGECFVKRLSFATQEAKKGGMTETIRKLEFISTPYRFDAIDLNNNEQLNLREYVTFGRKRFGYFDSNNDNMISGAEFCAGYKSSMPCDIKDVSQLEPSSGDKK